MGVKLYNDKVCDPSRVKKSMIYKLWLHCCRRNDVVTIEQMKKFAPYRADYLDVLDRFVDAEEKTTLNPEEYKEYQKQSKLEFAKNLKAKKAAKAAKKNF